MLCFLVPCFNLNGVVLDTSCEDPAVRLELVGRYYVGMNVNYCLSSDLSMVGTTLGMLSHVYVYFSVLCLIVGLRQQQPGLHCYRLYTKSTVQ